MTINHNWTEFGLSLSCRRGGGGRDDYDILL